MSLRRSSFSQYFIRLNRLAGLPGRIIMIMVPARVLPAMVIPFLLLGMQPVPASGQNGVSCHCFQNRSYNPSDRFAADDYILATGFNNLLARVFDVPHRQIVLLKMKEGVNEDELLIGMYVSRKSGEELEKILGKRRAGKTWAAILAALTPEGDAQHDEVLSRIYAGAKPGEAASLAADAIVREFYRVPPEEIQELRRAGLDKKEINLVLLLAHASEAKPEKLVRQYRKKNRSWSEIAFNLGLEPRETGRLIQAYPAAANPP